MKFYEKFKINMSQKDIQKEVGKLQNKKSFRNKGFTIIELVVVIAILAGFAIVGSAGYSAIRENQRQANHISNISTIESSLQHFATDYDLTGLNDTKSTVTVSSQDLGAVAMTDAIIDVDPERANFTTSDDDILTLLMPITDKHPLVTMGYLTDAPKNPWEGNAKFGSSTKVGNVFSYVYVADFKVSKKIITNPDGSSDQRTELQPTVRLVKLKDKQLDRNDFVVVTNGKTYRTQFDKAQLATKNKAYTNSLKLYGYNFKAKTSGENTTKEPDSAQVIVTP